MSAIKLEALLATSNDERYPASNIVDGRPNTFFVSTGSYPHEILLGVRTTSGSANASKISVVASGIKKLRIEKCVDVQPAKFDSVVEVEMSNRDSSGSKQYEQFQLNKATAGSNIRFLKLVILSGYEEFAAVYDVAVEGEEIA
jgi:heat shock protein beta-11